MLLNARTNANMQLTTNSFWPFFWILQDFFPDTSLTFSKIPDISLRAIKIPDVSRFSSYMVSLKTTAIMGKIITISEKLPR